MTSDASNAADSTAPDAGTTQRKNWLAVLARADRADLERAAASLNEVKPWQAIRPPESGMVMLRGRVGGTGDAFNIGEATVTRCAVRLGSGPLGVGYTLGRDRRKTELVALFDALLQDDTHRSWLLKDVVEPLALQQAAARTAASRAAAASKVEFFTMVRGEA
jgi:alpha-D-ribose 1-methylphosphonate 5-triphosphate synthase subunit PhnG